jgi:hypothetical protein
LVLRHQHPALFFNYKIRKKFVLGNSRYNRMAQVNELEGSL